MERVATSSAKLDNPLFRNGLRESVGDPPRGHVTAFRKHRHLAARDPTKKNPARLTPDRDGRMRVLTLKNPSRQYGKGDLQSPQVFCPRCPAGGGGHGDGRNLYGDSLH